MNFAFDINPLCLADNIEFIAYLHGDIDLGITCEGAWKVNDYGFPLAIFRQTQKAGALWGEMGAQTIPKNNEIGYVIAGCKFITAGPLYRPRDIDGIACSSGHHNLFAIEHKGVVLCVACAIPERKIDPASRILPLSIFVKAHNLNIAAGASAVWIVNKAPGFEDELRCLFYAIDRNGTGYMYFANHINGKCAELREADGDIELMKAFFDRRLDGAVGF